MNELCPRDKSIRHHLYEKKHLHPCKLEYNTSSIFEKSAEFVWGRYGIETQ
jgi:hypothetical protein